MRQATLLAHSGVRDAGCRACARSRSGAGRFDKLRTGISVAHAAFRGAVSTGRRHRHTRARAGAAAQSRAGPKRGGGQSHRRQHRDRHRGRDARTGGRAHHAGDCAEFFDQSVRALETAVRHGKRFFSARARCGQPADDLGASVGAGERREGIDRARARETR